MTKKECNKNDNHYNQSKRRGDDEAEPRKIIRSIRLPKNYIKKTVQKYQPALFPLTEKSIHITVMHERAKRTKKNEELSSKSTAMDDSTTSSPRANNHKKCQILVSSWTTPQIQ
mmetsp:Transcript_13992/g.26330  ORF Transcript_13992/g.26330 Transcript_13992/m.26330 type:complete len:114 (+) Transcript_13992:1483-1824(+)